MRFNRRRFLRGATVAAAAPFLPAAPAIAEAAPVRIGLLTVKTGPLAQGGIQMEQGITVFLKQKNYTLAGRKIELTVADTGGSPAGAKTKVQEVVERDRVDFILGPLAAFELLAISDYVAAAKVPIMSLAAAEDMTQRHPNPFFARAGGTAAQSSHPLAHYAASELKLKRIATVTEDFAFGYEQVGGFQRVFEDDGGKIVKKLWPPLVTADYTPYLAQIGNVDAVFQGFAGSNPLRFLKQYADMGLKMQVLAGIVALDDALLKSLGDEAVGAISCGTFGSEIDTPSNKRFVADMLRDYDNLPGEYAGGLYTNGMCVEAALEKTGGNIDDKLAVMTALRAISLTDTPRGPMHFDHLGNVVGNTYIRRCERRDGKLVNVVIKTYENVSQFWTYDEKWFLEQPVYSRDYPPAKNLEP